MPRGPSRFVCAVAVLGLLLSAISAGAQQAEGSEPVPYGEEEFSPFSRNLRRGEIIMFGSFPITLFLTLEFYDIYRFIDNFDSEDRYSYTPWPFRSATPAGYSTGEIKGILITAVSVSAVIAVTDYIIGRAREKRSER